MANMQISPELRESVMGADESYLVGMSNKGIYKRACKDLETDGDGIFIRNINNLNHLEISLNGEICTIKDPLWESACSCPSRTVCRHLITAILWLKQNISEDQENPDISENFDNFENPENPGNPDIPEIPDLLRQALAGVTIPELRKAMGSQSVTLIPMIREQKISLEISSIVTGMIPVQNSRNSQNHENYHENMTVKLLYPLEYSSCSCHKKDLCAHKASVILAWQLRENLIRPEDLREQIQDLSDEDSRIIRESACKSYALLCDLFRWGLVRMPDHLPEHIETSAVRSHALRMADAERMLREIGTQLTQCRDRRAIFNPVLFLEKLCNCAEYLENLCNPENPGNISESELGQFRQNYQQQTEDLELLPVGCRSVDNADYQGKVYYFLDCSPAQAGRSRRFLSYSEVRPVYKDSQHTGRSGAFRSSDYVSMPWGGTSPMKTLMYEKLTLRHAKLSEGKLSGSKDTMIVCQTKANLNCDLIREMLYTDFRELAITLHEKKLNNNYNNNPELDRLCFVSPAKCLRSGFDPHAQCFIMQIADHAGHVIEIRSRYKAERKKFISQLERIGSEMLANPEKQFIWLCSAYFENGMLHLYPVEVYDFIDLPAQIPVYQLPEPYQAHRPGHVAQIFTLLQDVENMLCDMLQSGLQSASGGNLRDAEQKAERYGMYGFTALLKQFAQSLELSRHVMQDRTGETVRLYLQLRNYVATGMDRLEILSALDAMDLRNKIN